MCSPVWIEDPTAEICALCLHPFTELRRSHIIPEYHFRRMRESDRTFLKISTGGPRLEKKIQKGLFERLLCKHCEEHLNDNFENEVHQLFEHGSFVPTVGLKEEYQVQVNYTSFRLYMLSILWRASVACRIEFEEFQLPPLIEEVLRRCLLELTPPPPNELPFLLLSVEFDRGWTSGWVVVPRRGLADDVHTASFIVGGLLVTFFLSPISVDAEIKSLLLDYDGVQRVRRLHVNDLDGLARAVEELKLRYQALGKVPSASERGV